MAEVDRQTVTTILTLVMVGLWIISAIVRFWVPFPAANVLDATLPVICGYWFLSNSRAKNGAEVKP